MTTLENAVTRSKKLRPRTKELYLQHVRTFLTFAGVAKSDWTGDAVLAWRNDMLARKIRPQSVNVALNALRYAAQHASCDFFNEDIHRLPPVRRRRTKRQAHAERELTWAEGRRLVQTCAGVDGRPKARDLRDCAIITLGLRTGMLRFSMCQLKFADVTKAGMLTFEKKGGNRHAIALDTVTHDALTAWIDWLATHDVEDGYVFRSLGRQRVRSAEVREDVMIGDHLTPDGLYRALRERAKQAGFMDIRPHVFRKTFLAWAKRAGAEPGQIAVVTGHKSDGAGDDSGVTDPPANMLLPPWTKNLR